jgi:hypothetical protein
MMLSFKEASILLLLFGAMSTSFSQELFINTDAASNLPKGVFGIRLMGQTYQEFRQDRNAVSLRALYGLNSRLTLWAQATVSNHHDSILPENLVTHYHTNTSTVYYTNPKIYGKKYPYLFKGFHLYAKYRFLSVDAPQRHFRMALFGEVSTVNAAHDEAEPDLNDNGGLGGGLLITQLYQRFAISFSSGFIQPFVYKETIYRRVNNYIPQNTALTYGQALTFSLSAGYRIYPSVYTDYAQDNYNLYLELIGKSYSASTVLQNDLPVEVQSLALKSGQYAEGHIGIQRIVNSNTRMELSVSFSMYRNSFLHFNPVFNLGFQKYFYRKGLH